MTKSRVRRKSVNLRYTRQIIFYGDIPQADTFHGEGPMVRKERATVAPQYLSRMITILRAMTITAAGAEYLQYLAQLIG